VPWIWVLLSSYDLEELSHATGDCANGTIGDLVQKSLAGAGHEIVKVGHKSGDFQVEIENRESVSKLYQAVGLFDAVAIAAGQVAFAPLSELTAEKWQFSRPAGPGHFSADR
jgi:hypothetical protein